MTVKTFKEDYPEYNHLEGDELWDKITEVFLIENPPPEPSGETIKFIDGNGNHWEISKEIIDFFTPPKLPKDHPPTESYRFDIIDFSTIK